MASRRSSTRSPSRGRRAKSCAASSRASAAVARRRTAVQFQRSTSSAKSQETEALPRSVLRGRAEDTANACRRCLRGPRGHAFAHLARAAHGRHVDADVIAYEFEGYSLAARRRERNRALSLGNGRVREGAQLARAEDIVPFGRLRQRAGGACGGERTDAVHALLLQSPLSGAQAILGPAVATTVPCGMFKNYAKVGDARCRVAVPGRPTKWSASNGRRSAALRRRARAAVVPRPEHNNMDERRPQVLPWSSRLR